jgi:DNA polymerase III delta prime subunit
MNQPEPSNKNQAFSPEPEIRQQAENSDMGSGMQAVQGDKNIQNQGNNNWLGNTWNIFFRRKDNAELANPRDRIQQILLQQVSTEVESRINSSLHNRVYVVLETEQNPSQVECPWDIEVKVGNKPKVRLKDTEVITVFDQRDIAGRLLILGEPGAGKTTMLVKLASELIKRANDNPTHPIPVLFSLSTWKKDNQSIKDWLIEQLKDKYGVRKDIGKRWVDNQEIIPLLDGLDEIAAERQEQCVRKINDFLHSGWSNSLVVCSRIQEYQHYATLLQLNNSLELCPFTQEQVYQYLQKTGNSRFWDSISNDADLNQLAIIPLLLNIIVLSAQEISIETWQQFKSCEERLNYLFDSYINRMFQRRYKGKQPQQDKARRWLGWLAKRLIDENVTDFLVERLQPYWLKSKLHKIVYNLITWGVIGGLIFGLFYGLFCQSIYPQRTITIYNSIMMIIPGLIFGVINGIIYGLISEVLNNKIEKSIYYIYIKYKIIYSKKIVKLLINGLIHALTNLLFFGLIGGVIGGRLEPIKGQMRGLAIGGLLLELIPGLFSGLVFGSIGNKIETVESLKFSFDKSLTGLTLGLIYGLIGGFLGGLIIGLLNINEVIIVTFDQINLLRFGRTGGLIGGLLGGLLGGVLFGLNGAEIENKTFTNQGIWQSLINSLILLIITFPFNTILSFIILYMIQGNDDLIEDLIYSLTIGLLFGIFIGIAKSGTSAIKHLVLRVILWYHGYAPWNYSKFLNYCTNRLFLQRVGGGYRFIHNSLCQHFGKAYVELQKNE